ncbi:MAG TPA: glycine--tRNA ligase subunit beta [Casimicrobiaceae bacterium]|jgi:glycyl-tRNA synthetase beta chain
MRTQLLLVELFTEELPPKALRRLGEAFAQTLTEGLRQRGVLTEGSVVTPFATPRRLAAAISAVRDVAPDETIAQKLMPASVARTPEGLASPALAKKLAGLGRAHLASGFPDVEQGPDRLYVDSDGKADAVFLRSVVKGRTLAQALGEALDDAIARLPIPKVMSYARAGGYYNDVKFVRPAHRLVALFGADVVPVGALGLAAGRTTGGHRFLSRGDIDIATAEAYAPTLEAEGKVLPSFQVRREAIAGALRDAARDATVLMPESLLDEVTALVEWPVVYAGEFDRAFLDVPQECLILTMQQNQKYFALADASGRLLPRFLLVSNLETRDPAAIVHGNERVLRARLADAKFFFDQDRKTPLAARVERLRSVVYHNKLGTQAERVDRLRFLATRLAPWVGADPATANRAAMLAKADLVTDMVGDFPELQGTMGRYYAQHDGEPADVCDAIAQHYWPRFAGDTLPRQPVAVAVALADKLESLAGLFGIGSIPTGDKDPFALRRAALGVVRILVERELSVSLRALIEVAFDALRGVAGVQPAHEALADFIYERLRGYLRDQGYTAQEVAAVVDPRPDVIADLPQRLAAVRAFEAMPQAQALAAANKRTVNILRKAGDAAASLGAVDPGLLAPGAEKELFTALQALKPVVDDRLQSGDYTAALVACAGAKEAVDRFFDDVMVMADDPALRANRLALLRSVRETMNRVADIALLAV